MFSEDEIWGLLGLPSDCADEKQVRRAYKKALLKTRPDEDPQGFMKLRQAYEIARQQAIFRAEICEERSSDDAETVAVDATIDSDEDPIIKPQEQNWHSAKEEKEDEGFDSEQINVKYWSPIYGEWVENPDDLTTRQEEEPFEALLQHVENLAQSPDTRSSDWLDLLDHPLLQNLDRFESMRKKLRSVLLASTGVWSPGIETRGTPAGWCPEVALAYHESFGFGDDRNIPGWSEHEHVWFRSLFLDRLKRAENKEESDSEYITHVGVNFETIREEKPVPILFQWWVLATLYLLFQLISGAYNY